MSIDILKDVVFDCTNQRGCAQIDTPDLGESFIAFSDIGFGRENGHYLLVEEPRGNESLKRRIPHLINDPEELIIDWFVKRGLFLITV